MSDFDEASYYEIALTNRQVLVAFVVLLVCVLAAFFAGVWVGRGQPAVASSAVPPEVEQASDASTPPREFEFFTERGETPPPQERPNLPDLAAAPRPGTTLAEDLGVVEAEAEPAPDPIPVANPPAAAKPSPTAAQATPSVPPPEPAGSEPETLVIQVFSSRDEVQARRLLTRLQAAGFQALLSPVDVDNDTMYRVRIGPFNSRQQAEAVAARARRELKVDTWITAP